MHMSAKHMHACARYQLLCGLRQTRDETVVQGQRLLLAAATAGRCGAAKLDAAHRQPSTGTGSKDRRATCTCTSTSAGRCGCRYEACFCFLCLEAREDGRVEAEHERAALLVAELGLGVRRRVALLLALGLALALGLTLGLALLSIAALRSLGGGGDWRLLLLVFRVPFALGLAPAIRARPSAFAPAACAASAPVPAKPQRRRSGLRGGGKRGREGRGGPCEVGSGAAGGRDTAVGRCGGARKDGGELRAVTLERRGHGEVRVQLQLRCDATECNRMQGKEGVRVQGNTWA